MAMAPAPGYGDGNGYVARLRDLATATARATATPGYGRMAPGHGDGWEYDPANAGDFFEGATRNGCAADAPGSIGNSNALLS